MWYSAKIDLILIATNGMHNLLHLRSNNGHLNISLRFRLLYEPSQRHHWQAILRMQFMHAKLTAAARLGSRYPIRFIYEFQISHIAAAEFKLRCIDAIQRTRMHCSLSFELF